ncbi:MAG: gamma-glutamyltransferase [Myxococcota bacterium]|nr:gamma-glutamyltransferase [Myxococcota bacterium]
MPWRSASAAPGHSLSRVLSVGLLVLFFGSSPLWAVEADAPSVSSAGVVVSSSSEAALAGASILEQGGNAVDAAVATAFAVAVTQPFSAGLGGGAFVLLRTSDGEVFAVDARETAPAAATRDMYVQAGVPDNASRRGPLAVAVPSFTTGMAYVLKRWGSMELAQVLEPAIGLAEGFPLSRFQADRINYMRAWFDADEFPETVRIQFQPAEDGSAEVGEILAQPDLAQTLRAIAQFGPEVVSSGSIGQSIVKEVQTRGGVLTLEDMKNYRPKVRPAVQGRYRGYDVYSFPPPSSGGAVLLEALNILEGMDLSAQSAQAPANIHLVTEAMKLAFADRAAYMGDPDFVEIPLEKIVSKEYAGQQRARIDPEKSQTVVAPGKPVDDSGTAHLSVTDAEGSAVAITMTINTSYGSGITVPGTGIILNNEMDDFSVAPDTPNAYGLVDTRGANAVAPGKRPLSSMTPTIIVKDGETFMVTGSPGGPRIISTVLLTILNVIDWNMDVRESVAAPRYHHQWIPDKLRVEPKTSPGTVDALRNMGHEVEVSPREWSAAEAIVIDPATGLHQGGADPRTQGAAVSPRQDAQASGPGIKSQSAK